MKTETTTTYLNLIQTAVGIEFDVVENTMSPALVCPGDRYIATYAVPGSYKTDVRKNVVEPILVACRDAGFTPRVARRKAEKALRKFRVENPLGSASSRACQHHFTTALAAF